MDYTEVIKLSFSCAVRVLNLDNLSLSVAFNQGDSNPYAVPIALGIYHKLESPLDITTSTIIRRIVSNHEAYQVTTLILD
jgi:hypothetical protein